MNFHPYADIFPKLAEAELRELAEDIKTNGQREKIWKYKGQILDGRNRFNACMLAGVTAQFRDFRGTDAEALALVVSANMVRRHLTFEQRAIAAAKLSTIQQGTKQTGTGAGLTQAQAAEKFDVSERSVRAAKKVVEQGSKALQKAVESGEVPLNKAAAITELPKAEQLAAAKSSPGRALETASEVGAAPDLDLADYEPDDDEAYKASIENVMMANDKLAAMRAELEGVYRRLHVMTESRNHFQSQAGEATRLVKVRDREIERLKKRLEKLEGSAKAA